MTIVRLEGGLFIHSPTVLSPTLRAAIDDLGTPQWIIGPNTIHYWWVGEWKRRSEEHTSELQSLMRISYAVFCLKKKKTLIKDTYKQQTEENSTIKHTKQNRHTICKIN